MWIGFFLVCVGALILLNNVGWLRGDVWDYAWPLFFILLGFSMILKRLKNQSAVDKFKSGSSSSNSGSDTGQIPGSR
jgi:hypothetical protein